MLRDPKKAWERQRILKKIYVDRGVPKIYELINIINRINVEGSTDDELFTKRNRALFAMYYLTGCRASEIVKCDVLRKTKRKIKETGNAIHIWRDYKNIEHDYEGIRKQDIEFTRLKGKQVMYIRTENRKNKQVKTKIQPIPIEFEKEIARFIKQYLDILEEDEILFDFRSQWAAKIINESTKKADIKAKVPWNIHFIRHVRATNLVIFYGFGDQQLVKFMGWTDARPAKAYVHLNTDDLFCEFYKGRGKLL